MAWFRRKAPHGAKQTIQWKGEEVVWQSRSNQKSIRLRVKGDGQLFVSSSSLIQASEVLAFIEKNESWISHKRKQIQPSFWTQFEQYGSYESDWVHLKWTEGTKFQRRDNVIEIPKHLPLKTQQEKCLEALVERAKECLPLRLNVWSEKTGLKPNEVKVGKSKSQWGWCSSDQRIRLSAYLVLLPLDLVDYVLVHELCHLKEKNHGKGFWNLLEHHLPDAKARHRSMRNYRLAL